MQDLRFSGKCYSEKLGKNFEVGITYRVDLISTDHLNENFTVLSTTLKESDTKDLHEEIFGNQFRSLPYNLQAFKDFAALKGINLHISDSTGANKETLVDVTESDSAS